MPKVKATEYIKRVLCTSAFVINGSESFSFARKMKFSVKNFYSKCDLILRFTEEMVTFTKEILD